MVKIECNGEKKLAIRRRGVRGLIVLVKGESVSFSETDFIVRSAEHVDKEALDNHRERFLEEHRDKKQGNEYIL